MKQCAPLCVTLLFPSLPWPIRKVLFRATAFSLSRWDGFTEAPLWIRGECNNGESVSAFGAGEEVSGHLQGDLNEAHWFKISSYLDFNQNTTLFSVCKALSSAIHNDLLQPLNVASRKAQWKEEGGSLAPLPAHDPNTTTLAQGPNHTLPLGYHTPLPTAPQPIPRVDLSRPSPADPQATHMPHPTRLHSVSLRHLELSSPKPSPFASSTPVSSPVFPPRGTAVPPMVRRVLQALQLLNLIILKACSLTSDLLLDPSSFHSH